MPVRDHLRSLSAAALLTALLAGCGAAPGRAPLGAAAPATAVAQAAPVTTDDRRLHGAHGLECQADKTCYLSDTYNADRTIFKLDASYAATPMKLDPPLRAPSGLRFDAKGVLHALDLEAGTLSRVDAQGRTTVVASGMTAPWNLAFARDGSAIVACDGGEIWRVQGGRKTLLHAAPGEHPFDVEVDAQGAIFVSLQGAHERLNPVRKPIGKILKLDLNGRVAVHADGFLVPEGMTFDDAGRLYVADTQEGVVYEVGAGRNRRALATLPVPIHLAMRGPELVAFVVEGKLAPVRR